MSQQWDTSPQRAPQAGKPMHTAFPIASTFVEWFQTPVSQRPVTPQRYIALVDFHDHVRHRFPAELPSHLAPRLDLRLRRKVSAGLDQTREIAQARFCLLWIHVAQGPVRYHDILKTQSVD